MSKKMKMVCIGFGVLLAVGLIANLPPIPQDPAYHVFADVNKWQGVENAANVISNLAFVVAGLVGLMRTRRLPDTALTLMWKFFFSSVALVGLGSAYYHWLPSNDSLFWDRLPMTLCFASLTACVGAERLGAKFGRWLFLPLVVSGALSVCYWWVSEKYGLGDLRPYILVQYLPMALIPLLVLLFPQTARQNRQYWLLLVGYIAAKGFELNDELIFNLTNHTFSGHTLKHLVAAAGILALRPGLAPKTTAEDAPNLFCALLDKQKVL
ncbi:MAG: ceramidase [Sporomusaceae bacterium]|jgi:hypothetical protein|nr:ceramidase [Sporomusaceae bacterium]